MELGGTHIEPYGIRVENGKRYLLCHALDFQGEHYDLTMYIVEDNGQAKCFTHALRSRYYAVSIERLMELFRQVRFRDVRRIDDQFFQLLIIGIAPS